MFRPSSIVLLCIGTVLVGASSHAFSDEWGDLRGRITYQGDAPKAIAIEVTRDEEVCGKHDLRDESLVVNKQNQGVQNVVVWLASKTKVPVHPSLAKSPDPTQLDNKDCRFVPHIVRLRTGQTLQSTNSDSVAHNVAVYGRRNQPFSIVIPEDKPLETLFAREELLPIRVDCSIHSWMRAYLVITEHPYSAVTDKDGRFEIKNIPAGEWDFRFWHERPGYLKKLVGEKAMELDRGTLKLKIEEATRDLGDLAVSGSEFAESN